MTAISRTMVATPAYRGDVVMQYAHCIVRDSVLAMLDGHFVEAPFFVNDTYIHQARNQAVKRFINETDFDFLMFIDADMGWPEGALGQMIGQPVEYDVIGGVYGTREDNCRFPFRMLPGTDTVTVPIGEVEGVATGFMRVTRKCAMRMLELYPTGKMFNHIEDPNVGGGEWGDDLAFCKRVREAGMKVYGRFDIEFSHIGPKEYKAKCSDYLFELAADFKKRQALKGAARGNGLADAIKQFEAAFPVV